MGVMDRGLALEVKTRFPHVYDSYYHYCHMTTPENIIGRVLLVPIDLTEKQCIANCFAQRGFSTEQRMTDYDAMKACLQEVADLMQAYGKKTVAIPYKMGCGLDGGDWNVVRKIIVEVFQPTELFVEIWKLP